MERKYYTLNKQKRTLIVAVIDEGTFSTTNLSFFGAEL